LSVDEVTRQPFDAENLAGGRVRQVAELVLDYADPPDQRKHVASVALESIEDDDVLAGIEGDWNAAAFEIDNGTVFLVTGRGAGRWPTAESIVADAFSLRRSLATHQILAEAS
jgi:homoserine dehydrogenase